MFLRRINKHLETQNWMAVCLDLVIVIVGVFIGLQVSNWNEDREARVAERVFIEVIRDDIAQDIIDAQGFDSMLSAVLSHGHSTLESIGANASCVSDCWSRLLDYFMASQWIDVRTNKSTLDEIKRSGLPLDPALKKTLIRYYGTTEQTTIIASQLPRYRELVRSLIPAAVQEQMWKECIAIEGRQQILVADCPAPISDAEAISIIESLRANSEIKRSLTFWMSTIGIVRVGLESQNKVGRAVIDEIDQHLTGF